MQTLRSESSTINGKYREQLHYSAEIKWHLFIESGIMYLSRLSAVNLSAPVSSERGVVRAVAHAPRFPWPLRRSVCHPNEQESADNGLHRVDSLRRRDVGKLRDEEASRD